MSRIKPYTTNQETWNHILQKNVRIPMNQREYSWTSENISRFLDDIFNIYQEGKYVMKMGSIINLNYNGENDIYDGQQRILSTILLLNVIGCFSEKLNGKIRQLLTMDTELDDLTDDQNKIKEKCNVTIIPKIYCINPFDMDGLVNIFNHKIKSWIEYVDNPDEIEILENDNKYVCNKCKSTIGRKSDFIRHISNKHQYKSPAQDTKLENAFIEIYNFVTLKKYDEHTLIGLYKFILNDIDIQYYNCNDPEYVSLIFDWENNRGKSVETLDIIKNPILVKIPDDKKQEIYNKWETLKRKTNKIYKKDFGQKIFDIAIQLYNNKIKRTIKHDEVYRPIINSQNTYCEINIFFEIVERLHTIMEEISNDKYGKLINNNSRISLNWEAYMWCLLPIFYKTNNINTELLKLMTKWYFRNIGFKNRNFNNLSYSNEFIRITNEVLKNNNNNYKYYDEIESVLIKNKDNSIRNENYSKALENMIFTVTNATHLLLFLETNMNTDVHTVPMDYTLEHIIPQKNKLTLKNTSLINNIGNLTLIEGKNSNNGHKGNSALGSKSYEKKIVSYNGSSSMITRSIPEKFKTFTETTIITRNKLIADLLNEYTNY